MIGLLKFALILPLFHTYSFITPITTLRILLKFATSASNDSLDCVKGFLEINKIANPLPMRFALLNNGSESEYVI